MSGHSTFQQHAKRILVVDDEPLVAKTICMLLALKGHQTETAVDGEQALLKFDDEKYDLILTDLDMPGMNGLELAQLIKSHAPTLPIILISAHVQSTDLGTANFENVDGVLPKPFMLEEFNQLLARVLATRRVSIGLTPGVEGRKSKPAGE